MLESTEYARAFNGGCDARLNGEGPGRNPFLDVTLRMAWLRGWWDVEEFWGQEAGGRTVMQLPRVA